jgi:CheY-like chemotaxis protein
VSCARPLEGAAPAPFTILVVEDEILVRILVTDELRGHGYTVIEAVNADEAVLILQNNDRVDLLLTDVRMPGTRDGFDLARLVRAHYPVIKVVIASADVSAAEGEMSNSFDGFFTKPYDFPKLGEHIKALLSSRNDFGT